MIGGEKNLVLKDVLLVEDDRELCAILNDVLVKLGLKVMTCSNSKDAIDLILTYQFSLVLTDINLGDTSGLDILTYIKQNKPTLRVVLMTGFLEETDIHDALELGVFGFLAKPITKKEIKKIVENAIGKNPSYKITDMDYARVDIDDFVCGKILNFPVYIRLKDSRFLKIAHSGTEIDLNKITQLKERMINELWIDKEDLQAYLQLNEKIYNAKSQWSGANKVKFINHFAEVSYESMRLLKFSEKSVRYCLDSVNILMNEIGQIKGSLPLMESFISNDVRASKLAVQGATYSLVVAKILGWTSEKTLHALSLGAFFRDIALTYEGFNYAQFFDQNIQFDKNHYKTHPTRSVAILNAIGGFPSESLTIIEQHHEDGGQLGFPNKIPRSNIFAPALIVNYVDKMLFHLITSTQEDPEIIKKHLHRFLDQNHRNTMDDKLTALMCFIKHGDIDKAKKEFERMKKVNQS